MLARIIISGRPANQEERVMRSHGRTGAIKTADGKIFFMSGCDPRSRRPGALKAIDNYIWDEFTDIISRKAGHPVRLTKIIHTRADKPVTDTCDDESPPL